MQPQDTTALHGVISELRPELIPARFEKAQQPSPCALQLGFRTLRQRLWLELHWQADSARFHAAPPPPRTGEGSTLAQQLQLPEETSKAIVEVMDMLHRDALACE